SGEAWRPARFPSRSSALLSSRPSSLLRCSKRPVFPVPQTIETAPIVQVNHKSAQNYNGQRNGRRKPTAQVDSQSAEIGKPGKAAAVPRRLLPWRFSRFGHASLDACGRFLDEVEPIV